MRYTIRGLEIRSENAAKPACLAGAWLLGWIGELNKGDTGLDLGCGKLRYTVPLARTLKGVTAVDSEVQLERRQKLFGERATVREYAARHLPNVRVCPVNRDDWQQEKYQVVLCSNVLSAIPCNQVRKQLIDDAYQRLTDGGTFMLTTQYRNSHFASWESNPQARRYLDGFLVTTARGSSFYGLIDCVALSRLCRSSGFTVIRAGNVKELAFVVATR